MLSCLWHASLLFASLWGSSTFQTEGLLDGILEPRQPAATGAVAAGGTQPEDLRLGLREEAERFGPGFAAQIEQQVAKASEAAVPIKPAGKQTCDAPDQAEILRSLPKAPSGIPFVYDEHRTDFEFTVEKLIDRIEPARFYPLIGSAQLHHCTWKCTVYFTEVTEVTHPFPFKTEKKCEEIVFIDRDSFHLCVENKNADAKANPEFCPGGRAGAAAPKTIAKADRAQQVQLDITIARIDRSALPKPIFRWAENQDGPARFGISKEDERFRNVLQGLHRTGLAEIMAEPRVITLSGNPAFFSIGGTVQTVGVHQSIGTAIKLIPVVKGNGKIQLEASPEITWPESSTVAADCNVRKAEITAELEVGRTLVIGGFIEKQPAATMIRVPYLADLPVCGSLFTWRCEQEIDQEIVILVTPRLVSAWDGAEASQEPPVNPPLPTGSDLTPRRVVAAPDILLIEALRLTPKGPYKLEPMDVMQIAVTDTLPGQDIKGLYMITARGAINLGYTYGSVNVGGLTVDEAKAALRNHVAPILKKPCGASVELVNMRGMQNIKGEHLVRPDGTVMLGMYGSVYVKGMTLGQVKAVVENHLSTYLVDPQVSVDIAACSSRKTCCIDDGHQACFPATKAVRSPELTIDDVVKMSKRGIGQKIIVRQMELTNAVFNLTADDIIHLHDNGVNEEIISAMQERRESNTKKSQTSSYPRAPIKAAHAPVAFKEIVQFTQKGFSDDFIIGHMEARNAAFDLQTGDFIYLLENGVSTRVLLEIQSRRAAK